MADKDGLKVAKDYHTDVPFGNQGSFHVKGANNTDWGMKRHLSNIFDPVSGNTVMFAFDHGYFMGSTAGLERLDLVIPKLQEQGIQVTDDASVVEMFTESRVKLVEASYQNIKITTPEDMKTAEAFLED